MTTRVMMLVIAIAALVSACATPGGPMWKEGDPRIFVLVDVADTPAVADEDWVLRHQVVRLNDRVLAEDGVQLGDTLSAAVFDERSLVARVDRIDVVAGHRTLRARLIPPENGAILLAVGDGRVTGTVQWASAGRAFYLRYAIDIDQHVFVEVDLERAVVLPPAPPEIPPNGNDGWEG